MHMTNSYLQLVDQIPLFEQLSNHNRRYLNEQGYEKHLEKGETLFVEGEPSVGICFVVDGQIKVFKQGVTGRQQTLHFFRVGESFNEIAFLEDVDNFVSAVALKPSTIFIVPCGAISEVLQSDPDFVHTAIKHLIGRIGHLSDLVKDLSLKSVRGRLAEFMLVQSEPNGSVINKRDWYTHGELAARLGTVTDVIQRTLRQFEKLGVIQTTQSHIEILDCNKLATFIH